MQGRLLLFSLLLLPVIAFCQETRFGVKAGANLSWLGTGNQESQKTSTGGYHLGFVVALDVSKFGVQPELHYSKQGGEVAIPGFSYKEEYDYINLPLTLKYQMGKGFNVHGGVYLGILLSATEIERSGTNETVNNIDEFVAATDHGGFAGIGYELQRAWMFELRYNYGLTNVDQRGNFVRRNRFVQLSATYFLFK